MLLARQEDPAPSETFRLKRLCRRSLLIFAARPSQRNVALTSVMVRSRTVPGLAVNDACGNFTAEVFVAAEDGLEHHVARTGLSSHVSIRSTRF